jgi:hypothetical protein
MPLSFPSNPVRPHATKPAYILPEQSAFVNRSLGGWSKAEGHNPLSDEAVAGLAGTGVAPDEVKFLAALPLEPKREGEVFDGEIATTVEVTQHQPFVRA